MTIIYLDMDGVLADFDKRAFETFGHRFDAFPSSQAGWDAMQPHQDFYLKLEPMVDAAELVEGTYTLAEKHGCTVGILTAVPKMARFPSCTEDKKVWLSQHFPRLLENFKTGPYSQDKQKHCRPGDVLIDDRSINIEQWTSKGGKGIFHVAAEWSLARLKKYLELAP